VANVNQYIMPQESPKNRKDIVLMCETAIKDAIQSMNILTMIYANINFIQEALPEIYEKDTKSYNSLMEETYNCEPSFDFVASEYYSSHGEPLINELKKFDVDRIEYRKNQMWLIRLSIIRLKVSTLLKKHTNWYFDDLPADSTWQ